MFRVSPFRIVWSRATTCCLRGSHDRSRAKLLGTYVWTYLERKPKLIFGYRAAEESFQHTNKIKLECCHRVKGFSEVLRETRHSALLDTSVTVLILWANCPPVLQCESQRKGTEVWRQCGSFLKPIQSREISVRSDTATQWWETHRGRGEGGEIKPLEVFSVFRHLVKAVGNQHAGQFSVSFWQICLVHACLELLQ